MEKEEDTQEKRRFTKVLRNLAESSTWHGVPKIATSPQRTVKCLWCIFLMIALGMTLWNLSVLFDNLNPVRQSQIGMAPELKKALRRKKKSSTTKLSSSTNSTTSSTSSKSFSTTTTMSSPLTSYVTVDPNVTEAQTFDNEKDMNGAGSTTVESVEDEDLEPDEVWEEATRTFKTKFRNESVKARIQMGHQKEDFIHTANFRGKDLDVSEHFKLVTSSDYGNCFTMDSSEYKAWRSGPDHGIKLRLNLEVDEYIKNFASGYGVRMVFHEPGTFPMPAEEGLTLTPGYESMIGLRVTTISRLDHPFGNCSDGEEFRQLYNVSYSVSSCMEFCRVESTIKACNCIPFDAPDHHFSDDIPTCDNEDTVEDACAEKVENDFMQGKQQCDCLSPCNETTYEKTISGRRWPNKDYLEKVLMRDECSTNRSSMEEACSQLRNHNKSFDYPRYINNFIGAVIYFEDLNYEKIKEVEFYKPVRFVCDIGGAMGLFLGGSLLSFLELFQLIMEVVLHCLRSKKKEQPTGSINTLQNQST